MKKSDGKLMRMKELSAAAGVNKGTILFYIKEGLIAKPIKKHANSVLYTEDHLNDIRLIKELQAKRFLPLSVIKEVMKGGKGNLTVDEIKTLSEIDGKLYQNLNESLFVGKITAKQLSRQTGLSLKDLAAMESIGLIHPIRKGRRKYYGEDDIRLAECYTKAKKAGFTKQLGFDIELIKVHKEMIDRLVEEEAKILTSRVSGKINPETIAKMIGEAIPILNTIIGIVHKKSILDTTRRYTMEFMKRD
ncbi:MAG: MerR family transcriptional regulator [Desulfobacterales bacterium]